MAYTAFIFKHDGQKYYSPDTQSYNHDFGEFRSFVSYLSKQHGKFGQKDEYKAQLKLARRYCDQLIGKQHAEVGGVTDAEQVKFHQNYGHIIIFQTLLNAGFLDAGSSDPAALENAIRTHFFALSGEIKRGADSCDAQALKLAFLKYDYIRRALDNLCSSATNIFNTDIRTLLGPSEAQLGNLKDIPNASALALQRSIMLDSNKSKQQKGGKGNGIRQIFSAIDKFVARQTSREPEGAVEMELVPSAS